MSPRLRTTLLVAFGALLAVVAVVATALLQGEEASRVESPPLELSILPSNDPELERLRQAERALEQGRRDRALAEFEAALERNPESVEAAVGRAVASGPKGTVEALEQLSLRHPGSAVVRLHLGLTLTESGDAEGARAQWRLALARDPDTPAALSAESLLHPEQPPGRPIFVLDEDVPAELRSLPARERLQALGRRAQKEKRPQLWLLYGVLLQHAGRAVSALRAYERAHDLAPADVAVRVAVAVGSYDKDRPAEAFGQIGPLVRPYPRAGVVRFHLGLLLLWLGDLGRARSELKLALRFEPASIYGQQAGFLLERLQGVP